APAATRGGAEHPRGRGSGPRRARAGSARGEDTAMTWPAPDGDGPLILIVDDHETNRKLARDVLRAAGLRTIEAASGAEAMMRAARQLPDRVLRDLGLPDMRGADLRR